MTSKNSLTLESRKYIQSRFPDLFLSSAGYGDNQRSETTPMLKADAVSCSFAVASDQSGDKLQGIVQRLLTIIYSLKLR